MRLEWLTHMTAKSGMAVSGLALFALCGFLSAGAPRVVLLNEGLRIEYPWSRGLCALAAAAGVVIALFSLEKKVLRLFGGVLAIGVALVAIHLLCYHLDATNGGLAAHGALGTTAIAWRDVASVRGDGSLVIVNGPGEKQIRVDTTDFAPEQRATLQRTIARHVADFTRPRTPPP